ncbi:MAG: hypothetical protein FWD45_05480 [Coriobacteriia bacterium]|nr:hypothetical protein [Coriobacteriia bacterium]
MEIFISHSSALEYWRRYGADSAQLSTQAFHQHGLPSTAYDRAVLLNTAKHELNLPIDVLTRNNKARRKIEGLRHNTFSHPVPVGSLINCGDGLVVSSPEFCFFQMASRLSLVKLIELGYEFCGVYSLVAEKDAGRLASDDNTAGESLDNSSMGFYTRHPLTSVRKLKAYVSHMSNAHGQKKAARAVRFIIDGSASPMETILSMLLTLPKKLGGYGLPKPSLNAQIAPTRATKSTLSKANFYCDLY